MERETGTPRRKKVPPPSSRKKANFRAKLAFFQGKIHIIIVCQLRKSQGKYLPHLVKGLPIYVCFVVNVIAKSDEGGLLTPSFTRLFNQRNQSCRDNKVTSKS